MGWGSFWEGLTSGLFPSAKDYTPYRADDTDSDWFARGVQQERVDIQAVAFDRDRYSRYSSDLPRGNFGRDDAAAAEIAFREGREVDEVIQRDADRRQQAALSEAFGSREPAVIEAEAMEITYEAYGATGQVMGPDGLLIPGGAAPFAGTRALLGETAAQDIFDAYLAGTGVEELNVDVNWFPGMELKAPNTFYEYVATGGGGGLGMGSLREHLEYEGSIPEAWAVGQLATITEGEDQVGQIWTHYDVSKSMQSYAAMNETERLKYNDLMVKAGYLSEGYTGIDQYTIESADKFRNATIMANYYGISVEKYLDREIELQDHMKRNSGGGGGGGGGGRRYTIEIPDYDTILQRSKEMLRSELGREPKDWEITLVGDEMKRQYGDWASGQKTKALGGNGVYEIPDPTDMTQSFIESQYEDEIARIETVQDQAANHQLIVAAATKGASMNSTSTRQLR